MVLSRVVPNALSRAVATLLPLAVMAFSGCAELKQGDVPPDGITCEDFTSAENGDDLKKALENAQPGLCVMIRSRTYKGSFDVPKGVTLASAKGERATIQGDRPERAAIAIEGGKGSALSGFAVRDAVGLGISVNGGPVLIRNVTIEKAASTGLASKCDGCDGTQTLEMADVDIRESKLGAWFQGGTVKWTGGSSSSNKSTSISGGAGIIAQSGAKLELTKVAIENNQSVGLLIDGLGGSSASLSGVRVIGNLERGLWAQKLAPVGEAPSLHVSGESMFDGNGQVGLGAFDSTGVVIEDTTIRATVEKPTYTDFQLAKVGDGLVLDATGGTVRNVTFEQNDRTAAIIARPKADVTFENTRVVSHANYKIVVQNRTSKRVTVAEEDVSDPGKVLPIASQLSATEITK